MPLKEQIKISERNKSKLDELKEKSGFNTYNEIITYLIALFEKK